jgi:hypothetical protein
MSFRFWPISRPILGPEAAVQRDVRQPSNAMI